MTAELGEADGGPAFVLYHGAVNNEEDGPVEVCVPKAQGDSEPSGPSREIYLRGPGSDEQLEVALPLRSRGRLRCP